MKTFKTFVSKITAYVRTNKILTLVFLSLLGGVPGMKNIYDWTTDKPEFLFHIQGHSHATEKKALGIVEKYYIVYGAIYNPGKQPLFPISFRLKAELSNGQTVEADAMIIDAVSRSVINNTQGSKAVRLGETTVDLMQTTRINGKDAQYGVLLFPFGYSDYDFSKPAKFTFICTDITQKNFIQTISLENNKAGKGFIPKTNVEFK